jgi:hypothetical protein
MKTKLVFCLLWLFFCWDIANSQGTWVAFDATGRTNPEITKLSSTSTELSFNVVFHGFYLADTVVNSTVFKKIFMQGCRLPDAVGKPELPYYTKLFAMPDCDSIHIDVNAEDSAIFGGYTVFPVPYSLYDSLTNGTTMVFTMDSSAYSQNFYSPVNISIANKDGSLRDQKLGRISCFPFKYNPVTGSLIAYKSIIVKIIFRNPISDVNTDVGIFGNIANKTLFNYSLNSRSAKEVDRPELPGTVTWITNLPSNAGSIVADYLIIANSEFFHPNDFTTYLGKFAKYRAEHNNYDVAIINAASAIAYLNVGYTITCDEQKIRALIHDIYAGAHANHTFDHKLAYVLLVGRAEGDVFPFQNKLPAAKDQNPGFTSNQFIVFPNDYYYSCLTSTPNPPNPPVFDKTGDVFIGRFSVRTEADLENIYTKIKFYETEATFPTEVDNFLNYNFTNTLQWWEDDYQPFVNSKYIAPYTTINHLPPPPSPPNLCQDGTFAYYNERNIFTIFTYGHSSWNSFLGCTKGAYGNFYSGNTSSQYKYPFCITKSCDAGWYDSEDYEPGRTHDSNGDCFAESIIREFPDNGFIGMVASSRKQRFYTTPRTLLDMPRYLNEWMPKCLWNDFSTIAGECILNAKNNMVNQGPDYFQNEEIFGLNYFGDPALNLMPQGGYVTINTTMKCDAPTTSHIISAPITVKSGARLKISDGCSLILQDNGRLNIESGATLEIGNNVTITGQNSNNKIFVSGVIGGIGCSQNNPTPIESLTLSSFQNASWSGIEFDNSQLIVKLAGGNISNCKFSGILTRLEAVGTANNNLYFNTSSIILNESGLIVDYCDLSYSEISVTNFRSFGGFVQILNSKFSQGTDMYIIKLNHCEAFLINNNQISYNYNGMTGIDLAYCGNRNSIHTISNTTINGPSNAGQDNWGIKLYQTMADVNTNHVKNNKYGVSCINSSSVSLKGNIAAQTESGTQEIIDNSVNQVRVFDNSFPYYFHYNIIKNSLPNNTNPLVYYNTNACCYNIRCNCFPANPVFYPQGMYDWSMWCPPQPQCSENGSGQIEFDNAIASFDSAHYDTAEIQFKSVIQNFPGSIYSLESAKKLLSLTKLAGGDYTSLKSYYSSTPNLYIDSTVSRLTERLMNRCNIEQKIYDSAINWFENAIINPYSENDSIYSIIDLEDTYMLMSADSNLKSSNVNYLGKLVQYKPHTSVEYLTNKEQLTRLLFKETSNNNENSKPQDQKSAFEFFQNHPNPFSFETELSYMLNEKNIVSIWVSDISGNQLRKFGNTSQEPGKHSFKVDLSGMPDGVYFFSLLINEKEVAHIKGIKAK